MNQWDDNPNTTRRGDRVLSALGKGGAPWWQDHATARGRALWARAGLFLVGSVCLWLTQPSAAQASPALVYFEWERPLGSTCPPAKILQGDVEEALGREVFTESRTAPLHIVGTIEEQVSGTLVRLSARGRKGQLLGTRELSAQGGDCAALRSDLVLVLTLLVEHETERLTSPPLRLRLGASVVAVGSVLPRWALGASAFLGVDIAGAWQLRADLAYWFPVVVRSAQQIEADLHAATLAVRGCPRVLGSVASGWTLHVCAGVQLGGLLVVQVAPIQPPSELRLLAHALLDLRLTAQLAESVGAELAVGPLLALHRATLYASYGSGPERLLYGMPMFGVFAQAGLVF